MFDHFNVLYVDKRQSPLLSPFCWDGGGGLSPRAHSDKTPSKPRYRFTPTLSDRHLDRGKLLPHATISVCTRGSNAFSRNRYRSAEVPGSRRKRLAQNHHGGGQPFRAAGRWRDHGGQPDHRDGLCRPCRPSTTRRGQAPCIASHQPQGLLRPENLPPAGLCRTSAPCKMALI